MPGKYSDPRVETLITGLQRVATHVIEKANGQAGRSYLKDDQPLTTGLIHTRTVDFDYHTPKSPTTKILSALKRFLAPKGISPLEKDRKGKETLVHYEDIADLRVDVKIGWESRRLWGWITIEVHDTGKHLPPKNQPRSQSKNGIQNTRLFRP